MRRTTFDKLLGWVGISLGIVLLAVGGLLLWGSAYVHNTVQSQLAAQQITFPPAVGVRARQGRHRDHPIDDPARSRSTPGSSC